MRVAVVQHDIAWEEPAATRAALDDVLASLPVGDVGLVVLAEMFATGFTMRPEDLAEDADGDTLAWLRGRAADLGATMVGSVPWRQDDGRFTNRLLVVRPDGDVEHYDKRHPFSHGREADHYVGGDPVLTTTIGGLRVTPFVCYDLRFADDFWSAGPSTDLFVVVANWPEARRSHWRALLRARAIENQCWVAACNRVGEGGGLAYVGDSMVVDPMGEVAASARGHATVLAVDVTAERVAEVREQLPFLADRR